MKIVIIDDETNARNFLKSTVLDYDNTIEVFEASTLKKGVSVIKNEQPNIVFLDIDMPEHSGLEILKFIDKDSLNFEIIFATAYDQYAVDAFEMSALDYLLKPIQPNRVIKALQKAARRNSSSQKVFEQLKSIESKLYIKTFNKIKLPLNGSIMFLNSEEVLYLIANGMYTKIYLDSGNDLLLTRPLKFYETIFLREFGFFRPHRKYLVNIHNVKEFKKREGGYIVMKDESTIPVSRDKKEEIMQLLEIS